MTTTVLPPGIYHIIVDKPGGVDSQRLTRHEANGVTILPPSAQHDPEQEWEITRQETGNIIIARPSRIIPTSYLTYKGTLEKPKEGDRIEYRLFEFPPNEWYPAIAPGFSYFLRVANSEFGIRLGEEFIYPPFLKLGLEDQLRWRFELVRNE